jgi:hypothetical protein
VYGREHLDEQRDRDQRRRWGERDAI